MQPSQHSNGDKCPGRISAPDQRQQQARRPSRALSARSPPCFQIHLEIRATSRRRPSTAPSSQQAKAPVCSRATVLPASRSWSNSALRTTEAGCGAYRCILPATAHAQTPCVYQKSCTSPEGRSSSVVPPCFTEAEACVAALPRCNGRARRKLRRRALLDALSSDALCRVHSRAFAGDLPRSLPSKRPSSHASRSLCGARARTPPGHQAYAV